MSIFTLILIGLSLAMDCMVVAVTCGAQRYITRGKGVQMSFFFGLFQGGMLLLGALLGEAFQASMELYDHWIAFGLLLVIGLKMIKDGFQPHDKTREFRIDRWSVLLALSLATSIDAFIVGIGLGLEQVRLVSAVIIVALCSFFLALFGIFLGRRAKFVTPKFAEIVGGVILIGIGVKILIEHL